LSAAPRWLRRVQRAFGAPRKREPDPYRAFVIGADGLAIAMHVIVADYDSEALGKAMQFQDELRIELWCGSRKVADIPAAPQAVENGPTGDV
jgi:hypothetical protein